MNCPLGFAVIDPATWGLLAFFAIFMVVIAYTFWPGHRAQFERVATLPLDSTPNTETTATETPDGPHASPCRHASSAGEENRHD